jgi:hypothetical protein
MCVLHHFLLRLAPVCVADDAWCVFSVLIRVSSQRFTRVVGQSRAHLLCAFARLRIVIRRSEYHSCVLCAVSYQPSHVLLVSLAMRVCVVLPLSISPHRRSSVSSYRHREFLCMASGWVIYRHRVQRRRMYVFGVAHSSMVSYVCVCVCVRLF